MVKPDDLPSDLASALVALRAEREARMQAEAVAASAQAKLSDTEALIAHLQLMIDKLKREKYGQRSDFVGMPRAAHRNCRKHGFDDLGVRIAPALVGVRHE